MAEPTSPTGQNEPATQRFDGFSRIELVCIHVALDDRADVLLHDPGWAHARSLQPANIRASVDRLRGLAAEASAAIAVLDAP